MFVVLIVIALTVLLFWAKPTQKISSGEPKTSVEEASIPGLAGLTASEKIYDFGSISMKDGKVSKIFTLTNTTNNDINLESVTTSCMCTVAYVVNGESRKGPYGMPGHGGAVPKSNEIIKAGESREIEVVYDPNAHGPAGVGVIDRFVYLVDSNGVTIQLEIKAIVTP